MSRAVVLDTKILVTAALRPGSDSARILERVLLRQAPVTSALLHLLRAQADPGRFTPEPWPLEGRIRMTWCSSLWPGRSGQCW